jgi:hypothetical protein
MSGIGESDHARNANVVADRAAVAARESAAWLREESARLYANYQSQSRYFKWRSWIIGLYVATGIVSIAVVVIPSLNSIKAYVMVTRGTLDDRPVVDVRNDSSSEWSHVDIIVNGVWQFQQDRLASGGHIIAPMESFRKEGASGADARPKGDIVPRKVKVKCDQGSFVESLN